MRSGCSKVVAAAAWLCLGVSLAWAQPKAAPSPTTPAAPATAPTAAAAPEAAPKPEPAPEISREALAANTLTADQDAQVKKYIAYWLAKLNVDDPDTEPSVLQEVPKVRRALIDPFSARGANEGFLRTYSRLLSFGLKQANVLESRSLVVRINAMLVVAHLLDSGAADLIGKGLEDASPACRYPAADAAGRIFKRNALAKDPAAAKKLLDALTIALHNETTMQVQMKLVEAIIEIGSDEAVFALLQWLNQKRVDYHAAQSQPTSLAPEVAAMQKLYLRLFLANDAIKLSPTTTRELARVAYRLMELAAAIEVTRSPQGDFDVACRSLISECDRLLRLYVVPSLAKALQAKTNESIKSSLSAANPDWKQIRLQIVQQWKELLLDPAIGLKKSELEVRIREEAAPAAG